MHMTLVFNQGAEQLLIVSGSNNLFIITVNVILAFQRTGGLRLYAALWMGSLGDATNVTLETGSPTGFPTRM